MRRTVPISLLALTAALTLAACGGSSYSAGSTQPSTPSQTTASSSSAPLIKSAANSTLGATILTSGSGMTLYRLERRARRALHLHERRLPADLASGHGVGGRRAVAAPSLR